MTKTSWKILGELITTGISISSPKFHHRTIADITAKITNLSGYEAEDVDWIRAADGTLTIILSDYEGRI